MTKTLKLFNMKILIVSFLILTSVISSAQSYDKVEDSTDLFIMRQYIENILSQEKDTLFPDSLEHQYRIVYRTSCPYTEMAIPRSMEPDIYGHTSGRSFWFYDTPDSIYKYFSPLNTYQSDRLYLCAENPIIRIDSATFKLTQIKKSFESNDMFVMGISDSLNHFFGSFFYVGYSFSENQYIILEGSYAFQYGNATNWGTTETLYLERVD